MSIIASCGHELKDDDGENGMGWPVYVASYCRDGSPAIAYMVVCSKCLKWYEAERLLLNTEDAQNAHLTSNA